MSSSSTSATAAVTSDEMLNSTTNSTSTSTTGSSGSSSSGRGGRQRRSSRNRSSRKRSKAKSSSSSSSSSSPEKSDSDSDGDYQDDTANNASSQRSDSSPNDANRQRGSTNNSRSTSEAQNNNNRAASSSGNPLHNNPSSTQLRHVTAGNLGETTTHHSNSYRVGQIEYVQQLIEECLKLYMDKFTCIQQIYITHPDIEPGFINLMWGRLEQQNPDFFRAYNHRLYLKRQIHLFNSLVGFQSRIMQQQGCAFVPSSQGASTPSSAGTKTPAAMQNFSNMSSSVQSPSSSNPSFPVGGGGGMGMPGNNPMGGNNFSSPNFTNPLSFATTTGNNNTTTSSSNSPAQNNSMNNQQAKNSFQTQFTNHQLAGLSAQNPSFFSALMQQMAQQNQSTGFPPSMNPTMAPNPFSNQNNVQPQDQSTPGTGSSNKGATPTNTTSSPTPAANKNSSGAGATDGNKGQQKSNKNLRINIPPSQNNMFPQNAGAFSSNTSSMGGGGGGSNFPAGSVNPSFFANADGFNNTAMQVMQQFASAGGFNNMGNHTPSSGNNANFQNPFQQQNSGFPNRQNSTFDPSQLRKFLEQQQKNAFGGNNSSPSHMQGSSGSNITLNDLNAFTRGAAGSSSGGAGPNNGTNSSTPNAATSMPFGYSNNQLQHIQNILKQQQQMQQQQQQQSGAMNHAMGGGFPYNTGVGGLNNMPPMGAHYNPAATGGGGGNVTPQNSSRPQPDTNRTKQPKKEAKSKTTTRKRKSPTGTSSRPSKRRRDNNKTQLSQERSDKLRSLMGQFRSPEQQKIFRNALRDAPEVNLEALEQKLMSASDHQNTDATGGGSAVDTSSSPHSAYPHLSHSHSHSSDTHDFPVPKSTSSANRSLNFHHPLGDDDTESPYDPSQLWSDTRTSHSDDLFETSDMLTFNTEEEDPCDTGLFGNEYFND